LAVVKIIAASMKRATFSLPRNPGAGYGRPGRPLKGRFGQEM
jgi:hypothetical protein